MRKWIALAVLAVLVIGCIVAAVQTIGLIPSVQLEMRLTPTPSPVFGNTMAITPDPAAPTRSPVLKNGASGERVVAAQRRLAELGYYTGALDGQFGNGTRAAVTLFQEMNGLGADGVIGPETDAVLYSSEALPKPTATPEPTAAPTPVVTATPEPAPIDIEEEVSLDPPYIRSDGMPLLVNKTTHLPTDYESWDLVRMADVCDSEVVKIKYSDTLAEREAVDALMVMLRAAIADGVSKWQISAAYRDTKLQQQMLDKQVKTYMKENGLSRASALTAAKKLVAEPGTSEHHLGTCFDITVPGLSFKGTKQANWLEKHCWEYGFILRYPEDKVKITGYNAEAWHFRWVGTEHSLIMRDENLCLEEYVEKYGAY